MYTLSRGPSKIVQKSRRAGIATQKVDSLETVSDSRGLSAEDRIGMIKSHVHDRGGRGGGGGGGGYRGHHHNSGHHHGYVNSSSSMPVFSGPNSSGSSNRARYYHRNSQEKVTPQQEDVIRFIHDKWLAVEEEIKKGNNSKVVVYQEDEPNPKLKDFEPFDLESWWGKRVYKNLTQGT